MSKTKQIFLNLEVFPNRVLSKMLKWSSEQKQEQEKNSVIWPHALLPCIMRPQGAGAGAGAGAHGGLEDGEQTC